MEKLNKEKFDEFVNSGKVLVDFNARWCGPCNMLHPILEELENEIQIGLVDVDENPDLAREFAVMSIPTLILFDKGNIVKKNIGFMNKEQIVNWLNN
ncbi:MAG: thioredoxin [Bacilli bacterium]|nr:thioredoxin [Bacilli bacterium]